MRSKGACRSGAVIPSWQHVLAAAKRPAGESGHRLEDVAREARRRELRLEAAGTAAWGGADPDAAVENALPLPEVGVGGDQKERGERGTHRRP